ncbi:uncharacterized protein LOC128998900 [Macrosteles quadrilineatus]|uniref:uncharacterized protein LOC128998900 n=1 Tax=Macrosteles quadrilineatus TaxID=74068 RepID=UPI0023E26979|nr:uncharacterized protein LOC128998900 [Macrosteles quadrilineatus]
MARTYVRKTDRGSKYSREDLQKALQDINSGTSTLRGASKKFKIPEATLRHHRNGLRGKSITLGRETVIPRHEEEKLAQGLKVMERWGWGLSRKELLEVVGEYVKHNKSIHKSNPFKNGVPGEDWFLGFKKRHRLSVKQPQSLEYARKKCTDPFIIGHYFKLLKSTLDDLKLENKPGQIFNIDETNFSLDPSKTKVVGEVNRPSSRITSGPGRENTTVLLGGNAAGEKLPPLIVFKGKAVWDSWLAPESEAFPGTSYASSKNGWMETEIFANYFKNVFLKKCGTERPVVLLYDGHTTHLDISVVELAIANNVVILKLPAHTSHLLQPMDLTVFKGLKSKWDAKLVAWQRTHVGVKIPKRIFSVLIGEVWNSTPATILQSGFKKAGIYPYDCNVVPKEKYDPDILRRYELHEAEAQGLTENSPDPTDTSVLTPDVEHPMQGASCSSSTPSQPGNLNQPSQVQPLLSPNASFEEVLLKTVKQNVVEVMKRKKVSSSEAEVITSEEVAMRLKNMKKEEVAKTRKKKENEKKN